jgi:peptidoglycan hydrolase-like protein with peptidoglycan-binding domain
VTLQPTPTYRYAFKLGMKGTDVVALQINLAAFGSTLALDGDFGPATEKAVKDFQTQLKLTVDGIAGIMTQRELCLRLSAAATSKYKLPSGLSKGLMENESGYAVAAYSAHPSDDGFDIGPYQQSFPPAQRNEPNYAAAYNAKEMSEVSGKEMRTQKDFFRKQPQVTTDKRAWELAALNHNWPAAAQSLARKGSIYNDPAKDNETQAWIVSASGGRLHTATEWVNAYISKATLYCTSWPA